MSVSSLLSASSLLWQFGQLNRYTFLTATSTIFTLSPSFLAEQPEEPSVQVVISVLAAWDREFDSHVIIGSPFRHTFQNITGKFLVRFLGHPFDHVHPIRVKQPCHRAFSNRIADVICPARRYQFRPTAREPIQHGIRFPPYRIL